MLPGPAPLPQTHRIPATPSPCLSFPTSPTGLTLWPRAPRPRVGPSSSAWSRPPSHPLRAHPGPDPAALSCQAQPSWLFAPLLLSFWVRAQREPSEWAGSQGWSVSGTSGLLWRGVLFSSQLGPRFPAQAGLLPTSAAAPSLAGASRAESGTGSVTASPLPFCASDGASLGLGGLDGKRGALVPLGRGARGIKEATAGICASPGAGILPSCSLA